LQPLRRFGSQPGRWDQGLTAAEMKRCHWVKPATKIAIIDYGKILNGD
jgi:hypothetical protein